MLGIFAKKKNVAYYSYAMRINQIFVNIINSFTIVVVPRMAFYYKEKRKKIFDSLISKTLETLLALGIPLVAGLQIVSTDAINILYGSAFAPSAGVLRILSFVLLISPIGYLLGSRVLLVTDHEVSMMLCVGLGAIVNIIGNSILIPRYTEYGAAIASVFSELVVMIVYVNLGKRYYKVFGELKNILKIILATACFVLYSLLIRYLVSIALLRLLIQVVGAIVIYFLMLYLLKEPLVSMYAGRLKEKLHRNRSEMAYSTLKINATKGIS